MKCFCILIAALQFNSTMQEIFTEEYLKPTQMESSSQNASYSLQKLVKNYPITSMIDAGCGENPWIPSFGKYTGIDIVENIITANQANHRGTFQLLDVTADVLPHADLILCRNTLDYFSYRDIASTLGRFKQSQALYLIANTCPKLEKNEETRTGVARKINLQASPFFFPKPLSLVEDSSGEGNYLGIWKLADIDLARFEKCAFPPVTFLTKAVGYGVPLSHWGVANSLIRGLKRVSSNYNVNPDKLEDVKENVVITGNHVAALQAYEWKKENKIKTLMLGPNFAPSTENFIIAWPLVTCYLGNCEWYETNLIRFNPSLKGRTCRWYAGVDENYWKPSARFKDKQSKKVLFYYKSGNVDGDIKTCLEQCGYSVITIGYGSYNHEDFKRILEQCKFAVFVSMSETQGIALAEAWSMDVPVLAWNPKSPHDWDGYTWTNPSSCPYMNPMVGTDWQKVDELRKLVQSFDKISEAFEPRRWVLLNMTDKVSVEVLLSHIRSKNPPE